MCIYFIDYRKNSISSIRNAGVTRVALFIFLRNAHGIRDEDLKNKGTRNSSTIHIPHSHLLIWSEEKKMLRICIYLRKLWSHSSFRSPSPPARYAFSKMTLNVFVHFHTLILLRSLSFSHIIKCKCLNNKANGMTESTERRKYASGYQTMDQFKHIWMRWQNNGIEQNTSTKHSTLFSLSHINSQTV